MTLGPVQIHIDNDQIAFKLPPGFNAALFVKGALQAEYCLGVHGRPIIPLTAKLVLTRRGREVYEVLSSLLTSVQAVEPKGGPKGGGS